MYKYATCLFLVLLPAGAQEIRFPESFEKLAAKAKEAVTVSLDGNMLQLAGNFLSGRSTGEAAAKQLAGDLKGIYVRSFQFEKEGEYTEADVAPVRAQLTSERGWSGVVNITEPAERVEVYVKKDASRVLGMTVLVSEKRELTVVYIDGPIDLKRLGELLPKGLNAAVEKGMAGKQ